MKIQESDVDKLPVIRCFAWVSFKQLCIGHKLHPRLKLQASHQEKHKKLSDFIDFLALKHIILKLKVWKVAKSSYKVEKLQKVIKVVKSQKSY